VKSSNAKKMPIENYAIFARRSCIVLLVYQNEPFNFIRNVSIVWPSYQR